MILGFRVLGVGLRVYRVQDYRYRVYGVKEYRFRALGYPSISLICLLVPVLLTSHERS